MNDDKIKPLPVRAWAIKHKIEPRLHLRDLFYNKPVEVADHMEVVEVLITPVDSRQSESKIMGLTVDEHLACHTVEDLQAKVKDLQEEVEGLHWFKHARKVSAENLELKSKLTAQADIIAKAEETLNCASAVGEIHFRTCVLSSQVHDQIKDVLTDINDFRKGNV